MIYHSKKLDKIVQFCNVIQQLDQLHAGLVFGSPLYTTRIISAPEKWLPGLESRSYHYTQCPDEHVALGMTSCTRSGCRNSTEFLRLDAAKILL